MLSGFFGSKVGMTQQFAQDRKVVPATVIRLGTWYVTQIKTQEKDGYRALQIGTPRKRYEASEFSEQWLKGKSKYFLHVRELPLGQEEVKGLAVGRRLTMDDFYLGKDAKVCVTATSKGLGFQGAMRRHGFAGGPGGHGSTFHRAPGSIGSLVFGGEVFKGRKLPGRTGGVQVTTRGLRVLDVQKEAGYLFVVGAVPGKKGSLVRVCGQ